MPPSRPSRARVADGTPGIACRVLVLVSIAATACGGAEVTDVPREAIRLVEEIRIGALDGGPAAFGLINGLTVDDDGRIVVLDLDHRELRIFGRDGEPEGTIGREGEGPGEFRFPVDVAIGPNRTIWVFDVWNGRYEVIDPIGRPERSFPLVLPPDGDFPWRGFVRPDGSFSQISPTRGGARRSAVYGIGPDLSIRDSVLTPPGPPDRERCLRVPADVALGRCVRSPASVRSLVAIDGEGNLWSADRTDTYRLIKQSPRGDTLAVVTRDAPAPALADADVERLRETFVSDYPDLSGQFELDRMHLPERLPYFDLLWAGRDGSIWVRRVGSVDPAAADAETIQTFDIFSSEGESVGTATSGVILEPPFVIDGTHVYAVTRDDLDVSYVVRLRIDSAERQPLP